VTNRAVEGSLTTDIRRAAYLSLVACGGRRCRGPPSKETPCKASASIRGVEGWRIDTKASILGLRY